LEPYKIGGDEPGVDRAVHRRAQRGVDTVDEDSMRLPGLATLGGPEV
jgi:hypothetical protein